jgi:hypothetical protein
MSKKVQFFIPHEGRQAAGETFQRQRDNDGMGAEGRWYEVMGSIEGCEYWTHLAFALFVTCADITM